MRPCFLILALYLASVSAVSAEPDTPSAPARAAAAPDPVPAPARHDDARKPEGGKPAVTPTERGEGSGRADDIPDPTLPGDLLRRAMAPRQPGTGNAARPAVRRIPVVRLRACVMVTDKPAVAIIECDQVLYSVNLGATFSAAADTGSVQLVVEKLDEDGVVLRIHELNQTLLLK